MEPSGLPDYFCSVRVHLQQYHRFIRARNISPVKAALGFVLNFDEIDAVITGVASSAQLEEILHACVDTPEMTAEDYRNFAWSDEGILDPSRWTVPAG
jgi:aryl-alcohol dehydrogenase-like predicted oxidoreductase